MMASVVSANDPMALRYVDKNPQATIAARFGKSLRHPAIVAGESTGVFICAGQSLAAGVHEGLYTPTNASKVDNLDIYTGAVLAAADPLVGHGLQFSATQRACIFTRVADQLVTGGQFQRVILIPVAVPNTEIALWDVGGGAFDGPLHKLILVAGRRARAVGINFVSGILWQQGESDSLAGNSTAAYSASFASMKAKVAAEITAPWFVARSTYLPGGATNAAIRTAQAGLVDGSTVFAGPDTDTLGSGYRYDDLHLNAAGNAAASALWYTALDAVF